MKKLRIFMCAAALSALTAYGNGVSATDEPNSHLVSTLSVQSKEDIMPKKILVVYYSYSGNTQAVARQIAALTAGTLFEITTSHTYPEQYGPMTQQAKKEIQDGFKPVLTSAVEDWDKYDTVFIGSPNWWGTYAPAVSSFLASYDFKGKTVVPFFTNGGGGMQNCERNMRKQLAGVQVAEGATFAGRSSCASEKILSDWLSRLKLLK